MPDETTLRPLSVWMREWDADGDVLPMGFVIAAEDLEARVRALETVVEAARQMWGEVPMSDGSTVLQWRPLEGSHDRLRRALDATEKELK